MLEFDPIASMRIWAVEVDLGAFVARIPPTCAADWLPTLMRLDVVGVLDLVEGLDIEDALIDGEFTTAQARDAAVKLLESASGRTAWTTMALVSLAHRYWGSVGADLMRMSVKFDQISLSAALDCIYGSLCKGMDEKGVRRLNVTLERAPLEFILAIGGQPPAVRESPRPVRPLPSSAEQYVSTRPKTVLRKPQDRQSVPSALPMPLPDGLFDSGHPATSEPLPDADRRPAE